LIDLASRAWPEVEGDAHQVEYLAAMEAEHFNDYDTLDGGTERLFQGLSVGVFFIYIAMARMMVVHLQSIAYAHVSLETITLITSIRL
jgi:hypothetical protein